MNGIAICENCQKEFKWVRSKGQVIPRFCTMKCRGHTGFRPGGNIRINELSYEEKLKRIKNSFEKDVVRREKGCWGWKGSFEILGYARLSCRSSLGARGAHRASWMIHFGKIPEGKQVNHICNNRSCCRPDHLYIGDQQENMNDKIRCDRQAKGSSNGNSKLNEDQVLKIKQLLKNGERKKIIADMFGVSDVQISNIDNLSQWKHVKP